MNTLEQIVEAIMNNERPTYEDLYWAVLTQSMVQGMNTRAINSAIYSPRPTSDPLEQIKSAAEEAFQRNKRCNEQNPKVWCGPQYDYRRPEVQAHRKMSLKIFDALIKKEPTP